jgi:hypothetical protein
MICRGIREIREIRGRILKPRIRQDNFSKTFPPSIFPISAVYVLTTGCDFAKPRNFHCFFGRISIEKFKNAFQTERQFGKGPIQVL